MDQYNLNSMELFIWKKIYGADDHRISCSKLIREARAQPFYSGEVYRRAWTSLKNRGIIRRVYTHAEFKWTLNSE